MKDQRKTKAQLIEELERMRVRVSEMEASQIEHERAEEKIKHLNAVLRSICNVNQLITKEKDLGRLLHGVCDNLVKNRGYHNVWIAFLDEYKGLVATAEAGLGSAFHPIAQRLKRGMFMGCGKKALVRKGVVVTEDPFSECVDCPLAVKYGGRGAMTVRLEFEGSIYGLLAVSVPKDVAVDKEEQVLFKEVSEDIAFALHNIELEEGRKLAGESIRLAAAYARNLIETCLDPFVTIDEEGKITDVNAAAEEITGYSRKKLIGTEFSAYFTDPEEVKAGHQEAFSKGSVRDYDLGIRRRDGHVTPVLYNASVYRDETGKIAGVVAAARDVTEWKKAEKALKESEARYRALFEKSVDGILVADRKTKKFIYANPAICRMLGYTEEELKQRGVHDIHPKESLEYVLAEFEIQADGERSLSRDMPCLKSDGTIFYADVNAGESVLDGKECSIGFFRDNTERKKAEQALKESEEMFRSLFETAPIGLFLTKPSDGIVIGCNQKAAELFGGSSPEEFVGRKTSDFYVNPEDRSRMIAALKEDGFFKDMEIAFKTLDGRPLLILFSGTMTRYDGELTILSVVVDITDRKEAEDALQKARNELESRVEERTYDLIEVNKELMREIKDRIRAEGALKSSIAEKEILIREIHHRVKNNLQVISSLLDMGNMRIRDASQAHEMFREAGAIIQAMALIHSMLYGARKFESVNIADFIRKLYVQLAQMYVGQSKKIAPEFHLEDVHLSIDKAVPLGLVVNEILANVFKHAFPGDDSGKVEVHLRKDDADTIFLRILDNGTGIPEEIDVEAANSMGLKLIRIIVREQLRGALSVERSRGTTISMEFIALKTGDPNGCANA